MATHGQDLPAPLCDATATGLSPNGERPAQKRRRINREIINKTPLPTTTLSNAVDYMENSKYSSLAGDVDITLASGGQFNAISQAITPPSEGKDVQRPLSPRSLHNNAPQYPRSRIGDRYWQVTDPHDDYCTVCGKGSDLIFCETCPKAFHTSCLDPHLTPCSPPESWFCAICIERGWNELDLSEFASPSTDFGDPQAHLINDPTSGTSNLLQGTYDASRGTAMLIEGICPVNNLLNAAPTQSSCDDNRMSSPASYPASDSQQQTMEGSSASPCHVSGYETGNNGEMWRQPNIRDPIEDSGKPKGFLEKQSTTAREGSYANVNKPKKGAKPGQHTFALSQSSFYVGKSSSENKPTKEQAKSKQPGKYSTKFSRFPSLPVNIDQAVSTIFEELESTMALKTLVSQLEEKVRTLQNLHIQAGKDALARKDTDKLFAENTALTVELTSMKKMMQVLEDKNAELVSSLKDVEANAQRREEEMAAWRSKMMSMLQP